jgi:hypothetical protein
MPLTAAPYKLAIRLHGERVRWFKAMPCSHANAALDYDAGASCPDCEHGFRYREVTLPNEVRALIQTVKRAQSHPDIGIFMEGSLQLTAMPDELPLGQFDKLVLLQREQQARERVVRSEEDGDALARPFVARVIEVSDDDRVYKAGKDYEADAEAGVIAWLPGGEAPQAGATYSCQYLYHPVYWFLTGELSVPHPDEMGSGFLPLRGFLTEKYPEGD